MVIVKGKNNPCGDDTLLNPKLQNYDTVRLQFTAHQPAPARRPPRPRGGGEERPSPSSIRVRGARIEVGRVPHPGGAHLTRGMVGARGVGFFQASM